MNLLIFFPSLCCVAPQSRGKHWLWPASEEGVQVTLNIPRRHSHMVLRGKPAAGTRRRRCPRWRCGAGGAQQQSWGDRWVYEEIQGGVTLTVWTWGSLSYTSQETEGGWGASNADGWMDVRVKIWTSELSFPSFRASVCESTSVFVREGRKQNGGH